MFAKRFFFICAGLLCLAVAYHVGATSATAKVSGSRLVAMADRPSIGSSAVAVDQSGRIYLGHMGQWTQSGTVPGTPVAMWSRSNTGEVFFVLENGELWRLDANGTLGFDSNVFGP